jgi:microcystin degradation protein MlrC
MRVAIAEFKQETNTFATKPTTLDDFQSWHLWYGQELIDGLKGTNTEIDGFLTVLDDAGIEIVPILATFAMSGGRVTTDTYQQLLQDLQDRLGAADPIDGVLLSLHGAMVTDDNDDPDGETLAAIRGVIGPDLPLVVSLDLHANLTARSVELADAIVGFKTSPHIDQRETGIRAASIMVRMLKEGLEPTMAFVKIPMVVPASTHMHHIDGPFKRLQDATKTLETQPAVLSVSAFAVQPWLDIAEMGFATLAVTDGDSALASRIACDLAEQAWDDRDAFMAIDLVPPAKAIARALAADNGPVVLSDLADGTGAGSPGDATAVIQALIDANPDRPAYVCVRDGASAEAAIAAGVGEHIAIDVGGKLDNVYNQPVHFEGMVEFAGPATFRFSKEGYTGVEMDMGPSAILRWNNVHLLIVTNSVMTVDPALYTSVGLDPAKAQIVVVKSHIQFRAGYDGIASDIILLDSPGMSSDHIESLPFERISRPIFPLDRDAELNCSSSVPEG